MQQAERREATRRALIDAFWQEYIRPGRTHVTVTSLCARTGFNRSTFYVYFNDMAEVLNLAEEELLNELVESVAAYWDSHINGEPYDSIFGFYQANAHKLDTLLGPNGDPSIRRRIMAVLTPAVADALEVPREDPEVRAALGFMLTALLSTLTSSQDDPDGPAASEAIALAKSFVYHGISPVLLRRSSRPDRIPLLLDRGPSAPEALARRRNAEPSFVPRAKPV